MLMVGTQGRKRAPGGPSIWWEDNIQVDLRDGLIGIGFLWVRMWKYKGPL
jgi:hypothetical protein